MDREAWRATVHRATESDTTEATELVYMFRCMDIQEFVDPVTK